MDEEAVEPDRLLTKGRPAAFNLDAVYALQRSSTTDQTHSRTITRVL